ncbi:MAG: hypothetical protein HRT36_05485 [Alphaproteobacteria bacterium]|nr:hypothetical protein [Alphaproteobacteria bacterium]
MLGMIIGAVLPLVKEGFGMAKDYQDNKHELALMAQQAEIQSRIETTKLQSSHIDAGIRDRESVRNHDATVMRNASTWVVNLNGLIRPGVTVLAIGAYCAGLFYLDGQLLSSETWVFFGEMSTGIAAFWFSDRSISKMKGQ